MNLIKRKKGGFPSLLSDFFSPSSSLSRNIFDIDSDFFPSRLGMNVPTANITETPKEYKVEMAAPGLDRKDFKIEVENNALRISAEKEEEKKEEEGEYSRKEYSFNSFSRTFALPENIKDDNIEAKYEGGILKVSIPKEKETPSKPVHKIEVK